MKKVSAVCSWSAFFYGESYVGMTYQDVIMRSVSDVIIQEYDALLLDCYVRLCLPLNDKRGKVVRLREIP